MRGRGCCCVTSGGSVALRWLTCGVVPLPIVIPSSLCCRRCRVMLPPPPCRRCECFPMADSARNPPCEQLLAAAGVQGSSLVSSCRRHPGCRRLIMVAWSLHRRGACSCSVHGGDMPVSTRSTLRANARSGWERVLGCPLHVVSRIFAAVHTHDPPCEQLFAMAGVGVGRCPSCLALVVH